MNSFILYLVQMTIASVLLYLFYFLVLKNTTFFKLNRIYLLFSLIIPPVLPLLKLPALWITGYYTVPSLLDEIIIFPDHLNSNNLVPISDYFRLFYFGILLILSIRMLFGAFIIIKLYKRGRKINSEGLKLIVSHSDINPFSVFSIIFINNSHTGKENMSQIIAHEKVHVRQGHSFDILLAESICTIFWINPFFWMTKEFLKSTHEYQADEQVREQGFDLAGYFMLLFNNVVGIRIGLANNFNQSLTLKRMKMMKRNRSPRYVRWLYLMVLPFVAIIVFAISCQDKEGSFVLLDKQNKALLVEDEAKEAIFEVVDEMPVFGSDQNALVNYLVSEITYPQEAKENGIQGKVFVAFTVTKTGEVVDAEIVEPSNALLDAEALRVISCMPDWTPGKNKGKEVAVKMSLPINFKLQDK